VERKSAEELQLEHQKALELERKQQEFKSKVQEQLNEIRQKKAEFVDNRQAERLSLDAEIENELMIKKQKEKEKRNKNIKNSENLLKQIVIQENNKLNDTKKNIISQS